MDILEYFFHVKVVFKSSEQCTGAIKNNKKRIVLLE